MERALQIQELLGPIFDHLGVKPLFSCSLVCKHWSGVALERLWSELEYERPLVSVLCPRLRKRQYGDGLEFQRPLKVRDWKNFAKYAQHVRTLTVNLQKSNLEKHVYNEIAQKRPLSPLLPKLSSLKLMLGKQGDFVYHLLFMAPTVTELFLALPPDCSEQPMSNFFEEIAQRMPNLEALGIGLSSSFMRIEDALTELLSSLTKLKTVRLPIYGLIPSIMETLSAFPNLAVIAIGDRNFADKQDIEDFDPEIPSGAFDALNKLEFCAVFEKAANLLKTDIAHNLESLYIHSPEREEANSMKNLLGVLSKHRNNLKELRLDSARSLSVMTKNGRELDRVGAKTLVPLQRLYNLRSLHLAYHRAFQIDDSELIDLVSNWPNLETLRFCSDPVIKERSVLTSTVLPRLAGTCQKLTRLSLYLDTHIGISASMMQNTSLGLFTSLREINFGTSPLAEEDTLEFTLYVSRFLPRGCSTKNLCVATRPAVESWLPSRDHEEYVERWKRMSFALEVQIASLERERARVCHLQN